MSMSCTKLYFFLSFSISFFLIFLLTFFFYFFISIFLLSYNSPCTQKALFLTCTSTHTHVLTYIEWLTVAGTTHKGIGPAYSSKTMRNGIRIGDLRDMTYFESRLRGLVKQLEGKSKISFPLLCHTFFLYISFFHWHVHTLSVFTSTILFTHLIVYLFFFHLLLITLLLLLVSFTHSPHTLTHPPHTHTPTHTYIHTHTHSHAHTLTHTHTYTPYRKLPGL